MVSRRTTARSGAAAIKLAVTGVVALLLMGYIGTGFASAGGSAQQAHTFGLERSSESLEIPLDTESPLGNDSALQLVATAQRDVTQGVQEIIAEEEAARRAAEEAQRAQDQIGIDRAAASRAKYLENFGSLPAGDVDFSVGQQAFIAEWAQRIDAYLAGSELAGYGETFATAAWENGIDPRWSPAISNTESTKGANCFLWHNAWGWGGSSWETWADAIWSHVSGLASGYGFTISHTYAKWYCPPNCDNWYRDTLNEMCKI